MSDDHDTVTGSPDPSSLAQALRYVDGYLQFQQRFSRVAGIQAAVFAHGSVVMSSAHGFADLETGTPLTPAHLFRVASHSKTFTATGIMQLAESGALQLDNPAARWIEFLAGTPLGEVTVRELLAHAGGVFRDGRRGDFWLLAEPFPDRDRLRELLLDADASVVPRNVRFKYSNIGYGLLGLVIEAAAGVPYGEFIQRSIIDRLGLSDTGPELDGDRLGEYAVAHSSLLYADRRAPIDQAQTHALAAATGVYSNAADLVTYWSAHCFGDHRLLSDAAKREMQHPLWETRDGDERYGLGLMVSDVGARRLVGHSGGWLGHFSHSVVDTDAGLAVAILTNSDGAAPKALAHSVIKLIDLAGGGSQDGDAAALARFTGRFANLFGVVDVALLGGRLFVLSPGELDPAASATPLEVVDDHTLRFAGGRGYGSYGEQMRFTFTGDGRVASTQWTGGMTLVPLEEFVVPDRFTYTGADYPHPDSKNGRTSK